MRSPVSSPNKKKWSTPQVLVVLFLGIMVFIVISLGIIFALNREGILTFTSPVKEYLTETQVTNISLSLPPTWTPIPSISSMTPPTKTSDMLFIDSFDDVSWTRNNWLEVEGNWSVFDGVYEGSRAGGNQLKALSIIGENNWGNYTFEVDLNRVGDSKDSFIYFGYVNENKYFRIHFRAAPFNDVRISNPSSGKSVTVIKKENELNQWYRFRIVVYENIFQVYLNETLINLEVHNMKISGKIGLGSTTGNVGKSTIYFDNFHIYKTNDKSYYLDTVDYFIGLINSTQELFITELEYLEANPSANYDSGFLNVMRNTINMQLFATDLIIDMAVPERYLDVHAILTSSMEHRKTAIESLDIFLQTNDSYYLYKFGTEISLSDELLMDWSHLAKGN